MIIHLTAIAVICVVIIDLSGFSDTLASAVSRFCRKKVTAHQLRPLTCSLCMTFWTCIIYLLASHNFTLVGIMCSTIAAFMTPAVMSLLVTMRDLLTALIGLIDSLTDKIHRL